MNISKIYSKSKSATALRWNKSVRNKDDNENIAPFVQYIICLSIFAYESNKYEEN